MNWREIFLNQFHMFTNVSNFESSKFKTWSLFFYGSLIVFRRNFFQRKICNSVVGVFSFSWFSSWHADFVSAEALVSCIKHVMDVTAVRKPEAAGSYAAVGHVFKLIFTNFLEYSHFSIPKKTGFFRQNSRCFDKWALFSLQFKSFGT